MVGCTYNPALTTAQIFTVSGTVALPAGVVNPASVPLTVTVSVSVEAVPLNPRILSVEVSPAAVTVQKGQDFLFTAIVSAVDGADESVSWSVSGGSAETSISSAGLLIVAANETASTLKVKAISAFNTSIFDTATVTLTDAPVLDKVLQSIVTVPAITDLPYGTAKSAAAFGLPASVTLVTDGGEVSALVNWNVEGCSYNPLLTTAQSFNVSGTVVLPQGVVNTLQVSLTVTVSVSVNAAPLNPQVLAVNVSPSLVTVQKGHTYQFYASVTVVDAASDSVIWNVTGSDGSSTISTSGMLSVGVEESNENLTIWAVSYFNSLVSGFANVTVTDVAVPDRVLQSIIVEPSMITDLPNGVDKSAAAFGLPASVRLITDDGEMSAAVTWDVAACEYDPALPAEQIFDVAGMVLLPQGVVNELGISVISPKE